MTGMSAFLPFGWQAGTAWLRTGSGLVIASFRFPKDTVQLLKL